MTRRLNWTIAIVFLLIAAPYYWLLIDNRASGSEARPVTIIQLRQLAQSMPGPRPVGVEVELIAWRRLPGTLFAAGTGLKRRLIGIMAFRLPVSGGRGIVIDSGLTGAEAKAMGLEAWLGERQAAVNRAMDEAGLILITHEHPDHIGGLAARRSPSSIGAAQLNRPQLETLQRMQGTRYPVKDGPEAKQPFAIAPGVVVIPAASHTPGSQMFFVRLASGREYLFAGDIATMDASWRELRARSRLVGDILAPEDRGAVYAWLKTIRALKAADPGLIVIPGHDAEAVLSQEQPTGITEGFNLSQIKAPAH